MTLIKKLYLSAFLAAALAACVSTQEMNAKAYAGYAQMKQQNARAIDTSSSTARRVHTVFNRMNLMQKKPILLAYHSSGKLRFSAPTS